MRQQRVGFTAFIAAVLALLATTGAACAQAIVAEYLPEAPRYYDVNTPLGSGLNMRSGPSLQSEVLATLRPKTQNVEVGLIVRRGERRWGRVLAGERNAWVAMDHLAPATPERVAASQMPVGLICFGGEPGWSVELTGQKVAVVQADLIGVEDGRDVIWRESAADVTTTPAAGRLGDPAAFRLAIADRGAILTVAGGSCTDGMSDAIYPWRALLMSGGGAAYVLDGCCRLQR
ncbi:MAG: hypothetical protein AAFV62_00235 [Pseudomonadota bacterium]